MNDGGRPAFPVWVAWKPIPTDALGAMVPLYETLRAAAPLLGEYDAFHPLVMVCPLGSVKDRFHPLTGGEDRR